VKEKEPSERSPGKVVDLGLMFVDCLQAPELSRSVSTVRIALKVPAVIETVAPLGRTNIRQRKTSWTSHHSSSASQ
jgi:hypothetical protein